MQIHVLKEWSNKIIEKANHLRENIYRFVLVHPLHENNNTNYIKDRIRNVQVYMINYESYEGNNIRKFKYEKLNLFIYNYLLLG